MSRKFVKATHLDGTKLRINLWQRAFLTGSDDQTRVTFVGGRDNWINVKETLEQLLPPGTKST